VAGEQARGKVTEARAAVARLLGAQPAELVFTASATEANAMALHAALAVPGRAAPGGAVGGGAPGLVHVAKVLAGQGVEILRCRWMRMASCAAKPCRPCLKAARPWCR
jgi:cysteine desulfurase